MEVGHRPHDDTRIGHPAESIDAQPCATPVYATFVGARRDREFVDAAAPERHAVVFRFGW
ncbi:hypothetical protein WT27_07310 [Burkholderia territorii]|uniref:Uncharacterized protein n=2 Tax=Burkholderia territorii TaxID=1503055 RepID=A0A105VCH9_9BURK|nr:hypothetical protein WT27_07310 [Burkholderia territorii]